jgi:hypothetical protein
MYMYRERCWWCLSRLSDWFTFRTSTNTTIISSYTYTLYMTLTLMARYRLSDCFTFRTRTNHEGERHVQCICIGRDVGGVCSCSKGEAVRQPVPSHEGERHIQCICIGRDVGGVCPCSKGEPVRQPVPSHEGERVAWYRLSDWFIFKTSTNTTNISPYKYTLYMTLVAWYKLFDCFTFRTSTNTTNINLYLATRVSVMYNVYA